MKHYLRFYTAKDTENVLLIIKQGFTSNVTRDGKTTLSFITSYKIRQALQEKILNGIHPQRCDFNLAES